MRKIFTEQEHEEEIAWCLKCIMDLFTEYLNRDMSREEGLYFYSAFHSKKEYPHYSELKEMFIYFFVRQYETGLFACSPSFETIRE